MRKLDLALVLSVIALGAFFWWAPQPQSPSEASSPSLGATPTQRSSPVKAWDLVLNAYEVAGLAIGSTEDQVLQRLGQPGERKQEQLGTSSWSYESDGGQLMLIFLGGKLMGATSLGGRWSLTRKGQPCPGFLANRSQVKSFFGEPSRAEGEASWVYADLPGELTYHFEGDRVSQWSLVAAFRPESMGESR